MDEETAGKINISGITYQIIKEKFNCIHKGKVERKNKGEYVFCRRNLIEINAKQNCNSEEMFRQIQ
jgi:hypothetical protein